MHRDLKTLSDDLLDNFADLGHAFTEAFQFLVLDNVLSGRKNVLKLSV